MAIAGMAQMGTALAYLESRFPGVSLTHRLFQGPHLEALRRPLPHIANHIVQTIAVGLLGLRRGRAKKSIHFGIQIGETTLPDIAREKAVIV